MLALQLPAPQPPALCHLTGNILLETALEDHQKDQGSAYSQQSCRVGGVKGGQRGRFPSLLLGQPRPVPYHPDPLNAALVSPTLQAQGDRGQEKASHTLCAPSPGLTLTQCLLLATLTGKLYGPGWVVQVRCYGLGPGS